MLGLTRPAAVKRQFLHHVFRQLEEHTSDELQPRKRRDDVLGDPDWTKVRRFADTYQRDMHVALRTPAEW